MLEIIIIIGVVSAFRKQAEKKNLNKTIWAIIGAASYYVPILLMSFFILPALVINGVVPVTSEDSLTVISIVTNLITGITCCFIAYQILKNQRTKINESEQNILDQEL